MAAPRRFPPPWTIEELDPCFLVRDHSGQALAYLYFEDDIVDCGTGHGLPEIDVAAFDLWISGALDREISFATKASNSNSEKQGGYFAVTTTI
jgi:hypothetical protein